MNKQRQLNPNKKYKELKQKQKARIADFMYEETQKFYEQFGYMPYSKEDSNAVVEKVYNRVTGLGFWIPYEEVYTEYRKKRQHYVDRLEAAGLPDHIVVHKEKALQKQEQPTPSKKSKRKKDVPESPLLEQDDRFFFIAGYTSGGAPYGVTWEEMGLEPWEKMNRT